MYWLTGGLHSPETGSPEMLMELAYRLAVEDSPEIRTIREGVITLITPVLEVDGRERMLDTIRWWEKNPKVGLPPLVYWGHYVAHDNNRDAMSFSLALTRNVMAGWTGLAPAGPARPARVHALPVHLHGHRARTTPGSTRWPWTPGARCPRTR